MAFGGVKETSQVSRFALQRYGVALLCVAGALILRWLLDPIFGNDEPLVTVYGAVAVIIWYCGWGPALFAILTGYIAANWFFIEPRFTFSFTEKAFFEFGTFFAIVSIIAGFGEILRRAQRQVQRVGEFDEAIMSSMGEGLYTVDTKGRVTSINPAGEDLFGWTRAELLGRKMHDVTHYKHPDGTVFPAEDCPGLQVLREGKILKDQEDVFIRKDGKFFDVVYSSSPIWADKKIIGLVVVFRDVSGRKRMEEQLVKSSKLDSIGLLAGGIAHDFNNVLTAIIGNLSLAKICIGPEHKGFQRLQESEKAALHGKSLAQQLLTSTISRPATILRFK